MSFYQIFLCRCYTKLSAKNSLFHAFSVPDMQLRRFFCKKQLHLCARHAVSAACCGRFLQKARVFSVCFGARLQGVVTNRWGRAACFLTITGVMLPLLNWGPEYRECAARFFCVCMPSARCIMLRIVGWGCVCVFGMLTCAHGRCVIVRCAKAFACLVNSGF